MLPSTFAPLLFSHMAIVLPSACSVLPCFPLSSVCEAAFCVITEGFHQIHDLLAPFPVDGRSGCWQILLL